MYLSLYDFDKKYISESIKYIVGVDEVGRGCLAGPVLACAIILNYDYVIKGVNDSKKLSILKRNNIYEEVIKNALNFEVACVDNKKIDEINILNASKLAMQNALSKLKIRPDLVLIDGISSIESKYNIKTIIKGDQKSATIACASIVAKVTRDKIMTNYHNIYPNYSFNLNKGYPTNKHIKSIYEHGVSPIHRLSYKPVLNYLNNN